MLISDEIRKEITEKNYTYIVYHIENDQIQNILLKSKDPCETAKYMESNIISTLKELSNENKCIFCVINLNEESETELHKSCKNCEIFPIFMSIKIE